MNIEKAIGIIKSLPTDQAIQRIKSMITGEPESVVIEGELVVILVNQEDK